MNRAELDFSSLKPVNAALARVLIGGDQWAWTDDLIDALGCWGKPATPKVLIGDRMANGLLFELELSRVDQRVEWPTLTDQEVFKALWKLHRFVPLKERGNPTRRIVTVSEFTIGTAAPTQGLTLQHVREAFPRLQNVCLHAWVRSADDIEFEGSPKGTLVHGELEEIPRRFPPSPEPSTPPGLGLELGKAFQDFSREGA